MADVTGCIGPGRCAATAAGAECVRCAYYRKLPQWGHVDWAQLPPKVAPRLVAKGKTPTWLQDRLWTDNSGRFRWFLVAGYASMYTVPLVKHLVQSFLLCIRQWHGCVALPTSGATRRASFTMLLRRQAPQQLALHRCLPSLKCFATW